MNLAMSCRSVNECWACDKDAAFIVVVMNNTLFPECCECYQITLQHPQSSKAPTISLEEAQVILIKEAL